ncbi:hypothetical protein IAR55_004081 [Kwoniella newhampshirensis]|uniref:Uncharacterized protein n=1 Tax=Kwoniella newhampshirensis TaxID=1651941 RepID=A0AAW0YLG3_9TREE
MSNVPTTPTSNRIMGPPPLPASTSTAMVVKSPSSTPTQSRRAAEAVSAKREVRSPTPFIKSEVVSSFPITPTHQRASTLPPTPISRSPIRSRSLTPSPRRRRASATPSPASNKTSFSAAISAKLAALGQRSEARSATARPTRRTATATATPSLSQQSGSAGRMGTTLDDDVEQEAFWTGRTAAAGRSSEQAIEVDSPPTSPTPISRGGHNADSGSALVLTTTVDRSSGTPAPRQSFRRGSSELSTASLRSEFTPFARASIFDTSDPRYGRRYQRGEGGSRTENTTNPLPPLPLLLAPVIPPRLIDVWKQGVEVIQALKQRRSEGAILLLGDEEEGDSRLTTLKVLIEVLFSDDGELTLANAIISDLAQSKIGVSRDHALDLLAFLLKATYQSLAAHITEYPSSSSPPSKKNLMARQATWYQRHKIWAELETVELRVSVSREIAEEVVASLMAIWSGGRMHAMIATLSKSYENVTPVILRRTIKSVGEVCMAEVNIAWSV